MSTATLPETVRTSPFHTAADMVRAIVDEYGIPLERVRMNPAPGTATEDDLLAANDAANRTALCELIDGTLVEKSMGYHEAGLAAALIEAIVLHQANAGRVGVVLGADAMTRFVPGNVRMPDVSFVRFDRVADLDETHVPVAEIVSDWAVEVLSPGNTNQEIVGKRELYFSAGTELMWIADPRKQTVEVWTSVDDCVVYGIGDSVDVLPGFTLKVADWFAWPHGPGGK